MTIELKPCPFCGGEAKIDNYGTCISLLCDDCGVGFDWQVCDVVDNWSQYKFIETKEYIGYEKAAVDITVKALKEEWNTRHV